MRPKGPVGRSRTWSRTFLALLLFSVVVMVVPAAAQTLDSVPGEWHCNIPACSGEPWVNPVINWNPTVAYPSNGRTGNNSRSVFSPPGPPSGATLYPYMGAWANGCGVTVNSGIVLIIEWQRGTDVWRQTLLNPGETHQINLTAPEDGAMIEARQGDPPFQVTLSSCNPQPIPVVRFADLVVSVTDGQTNAIAGTPVTYTITVENFGPDTLSQINLTATLDPDVNTPVFTPSTGTYNPATGVWSGLTFDSGDTISMTLTAMVSPTGSGTIPVTVTAFPISPDFDGEWADNEDTDTDTVVRSADLSVTNTDDQTSITPGSPITYLITVSNAGPSTLTRVNLTDTRPAALLSPVFTPASGSYNSGTGSWTGITLPPGGSVSMTLSGMVSASATGTLVNIATVAAVSPDGDPVPGNNSATDTDTLGPTANLSVTKTDGQTTATPGTPVTYTITVSNAGPTAVSQITLNDPPPAALLSPVFTPSLGSYNSGNGAWTGITLGQGGSVSMTVTGTISATASGSLVNTATVATVAPELDPNLANNTATDADTLVPSGNLSVSLTDSQTTETPGTSVSYAITVSNAGPSALTRLNLTGTLSADLLGPVFTPAIGSYDSGTGAWTGVTLAPGGSISMTLTGTINAAATGTLVNGVTVATVAPDVDPNLGNNTASDSDTLVPSANLAVTKTGPASVAAGQDISYTIVVTNVGPSQATGVSVGDATPAGSTFASSDCGAAFPCAVGTMTVGQTRTIIATFTIGTSYSSPTFSNTATVSATTSDPVSTNNSSTATSTVVLSSSADLSITKTGPTSAVRGEDVTYTITVTNNGPAGAANVQVSDSTPPGLTFVSNSGDCTVAFPCPLGSLGAGATRTVTATFLVPEDYAGPNPLQSVASVSGTTTDPDPSNNSATATTTLRGLAFHTLAPCRVLDTRDPASGPALGPGPARVFTIAGICGVPSMARALSVNVTVTQPTDAGDLRIYPRGADAPLASAINYARGQTRANNAVVKLGDGGAVEVLRDQAAGTVHFILDVNGYFE
jgi:uncharacterized repeat protein (TIGR01451 family)